MLAGESTSALPVSLSYIDRLCPYFTYLTSSQRIGAFLLQSWFDHAHNENQEKLSVRFAMLTLYMVDAAVAFRNCYMRTLEKFVMSEVKKVTELPDVSGADINRLLPTIYDAATCYHAGKWGVCFYETWEEWRWSGHIKLQRDYTVDPTPQERTAEHQAIGLMCLAVFTPIFIILSFLLLFLFVMPIPLPTHPALVTQDVFGIPSLLIIIGFLQWMLHRFLPYRYIPFSLFIECSLTVAVLHTISAWYPTVNQAWRSVDKMTPKKYRVLLPIVHPEAVILIVVWLVAFVCIIRILYRIVKYIGFQLSDRRRFPGYHAPAQQSAALILGFLHVSHDLAAWEHGIPDRKTAEPRVIAAKLPPPPLRNHTDYVLSDMAYRVQRYWKVAMRSSSARSAGERMAQYASDISYFLDYQRLKSMLGSANFIKLREAMVTALIQSADGNWQLIGKNEDSEPIILTTRWKTFLRRLMTIVIPVAAAIVVSLFARKIPALYIQSVLLVCIAFTIVQIIGLIDPEALARLDLATKEDY